MSKSAFQSFDIVSALCSKYAIFSSDENYYRNVVSLYSDLEIDKQLQKSEAKVLDDIRNSIKGNNEWFITYVNGVLKSRKAKLSLLNKIFYLCTKWFIEIDVDTLASILSKAPALEKAFKEVVTTAKPATFSNLESLTSNKYLSDLLIGYATIKNLIVEEKGEDRSEDNDPEEKENVLNNAFNNDLVKIYFQEMARYPLLKPEDERVWAMLAKEGDIEAKKTMANHNLRLVVNMAKRYIGRGLDFLDLIQAGNEGLLKAIDRYDPEKGFRFSTYATWWIRQTIDRTIKDESRTVRIPVHLQDTYYKLVKTKEKLSKQYGSDVSWDDVAYELGMDPDSVANIVLKFMEPVSTNMMVGDDKETELGEFLPDEDAESPEDLSIRSALLTDINVVLSTLPQREEKVIRLRFGLPDPDNPDPEYNRTHTLEEVGALLDVTRERIRQIEAKALRKLRHPTRSRKLEAYYDSEGKPAQGGSAASTKDSKTFKKTRYTVPKTFISKKIDRKPLYGPVRVIMPGDPDWTPPLYERKEMASGVGIKQIKEESTPSVPSVMEDEMSKKYKETKLLWQVVKCTEEEFTIIKPYIITQKEMKCYEILFRIYGENLDAPGFLGDYSAEDKKNYYNGITLISKILGRLRFLGYKSLKEKIGTENEEEYAQVVEFLKQSPNFGIIEQVHGKSLGCYANEAILLRKDEVAYIKLIDSAQIYLTNYRDRKYLQERISCSKVLWPTLVRVLLDKNNKDTEVLKTIYGDMLDQKEDFNKVNFKVKNQTLRIISSINELVTSYNEVATKTLLDLLDMQEDDLPSLEGILKQNEELKNDVDLLYPNSYTTIVNSYAYLSMGSKGFNSLIERIKKMLSNTKPSLLVSFELGEEDTDIIIALKAGLQKKNPEDLKKLMARYGESLLEAKNASGEDVYSIITKLKPRVEIAKELKGKTIYEAYNMTYGEVIRFRENILNVRYSSIVKAMYGQNASDVFSLEGFFSLDGRVYYGYTVGADNWLKRIREDKNEIDALADLYQGRTLEEIAGLSKDEIMEIIAKSQSAETALCLSTIHGPNNDRPFSVYTPEISSKILLQYNDIIKSLQASHTVEQNRPADDGANGSPNVPSSPVSEGEEPEVLAPGNSVANLTEYTHPLFREAIKVVPINYRYILSLYLGLQPDGICYPIETLMEIFNRSREEIEEALTRGKIFFDEIVAAYEKVYARSFPAEEMGETRKRVNKN